MKIPFLNKSPPNPNVALGRSITWTGSKQTYYTIRLLVDRDLVNDCYQAYAYFRWADDFIDISSQSDAERIAFIQRQKGLIDRCYGGEYPENLTLEEGMIVDLIHHDRGGNGGLKSFIYHFLRILIFDAHRRGQKINQNELTWYSKSLAKAVTDGIQYFIGRDHEYPNAEERYHAAFAAHITHMLRDLLADFRDGYINIPKDWLMGQNINPEKPDDPVLRAWVQERVDLAREMLLKGQLYLDSLNVLRCKIAGFWYCARYEWVLNAIARDDYGLREAYQPNFAVGLKMIWLGLAVSIRHCFQRAMSTLRELRPQKINVDKLPSKTAITRQKKGTSGSA